MDGNRRLTTSSLPLRSTSSSSTSPLPSPPVFAPAMESNIEPTYVGYIATTQDALVLSESCLRGIKNHVPRRPHDRERQSLIKSGSVFVYEEQSSGIKRWTDGVSWSPSRILGNFLIYRELDKPFTPGEKKRALKNKKKRPSISGGIEKPDSSGPIGSRAELQPLIGSLIDSYDFKDSGLVKKTISIRYNGVTHHIVGYYSLDDVVNGRLLTPSSDPAISFCTPRAELLMDQNFRSLVEDFELAFPPQMSAPAPAPAHLPVPEPLSQFYDTSFVQPGYTYSSGMTAPGPSQQPLHFAPADYGVPRYTPGGPDPWQQQPQFDRAPSYHVPQQYEWGTPNWSEGQ
ncbi:Gti1/Pac2 family-domain-containing protein [Stachybotrys elegans]|uniref:Gti1/Pac2 family-domain-containing protein n=1 Tax=Stachybotrys elegans TaxID=80388 RepID=A0A8K0WL62_9HYPO|nr:Gti1/Pac2 family-domain-containing protein [Stachybotrys elegans]